MSELNKQIEDNKHWRTFIKENRCWTPTAEAIGKLAYNNGYNKAKKELAQSFRWRKFGVDDLPKIGRQIICRDGDKYHLSKPISHDGIHWLAEHFIEWKPID